MARTVKEMVDSFLSYQEEQNRLTAEFREAEERGEVFESTGRRLADFLDLESISPDDVDRDCEEVWLIQRILELEEANERIQNTATARTARNDQLEAERDELRGDNERLDTENRELQGRNEGLKSANEFLRWRLGMK